MGDLPLGTPRHRRLGGPLPRQLPNVARARPVPFLLKSRPCGLEVSWGVSPRFRGLSPGTGLVAHVLLTRAPVAIKVLLPYAAPRLACVKPVASVHPEPGSNSSL